MWLGAVPLVPVGEAKKTEPSKLKGNPQGVRGTTFFEEISEERAPKKKGITGAARYEQLSFDAAQYLCRRSTGTTYHRE